MSDHANGTASLFDQLCARWTREAELLVRDGDLSSPIVVLLPRDVDADEVPIRLDGLRGNLAERGAALVEEILPTARLHRPAGLVFLAQLRLGALPALAGADDTVVVYVSLGAAAWRRAVAFAVRRPAAAAVTLAPLAEQPDPSTFAWLDALLAT
ncbi:MAG: hypothetical protein QOG49_824 [Frankiaceae bacterium]|jgi:hypothetical protein|nr:hypothetical protein [Frankiaceae bacterium]